MNKRVFWVICLVFGLTSATYGMQPRHQPNIQRLAKEISVTDEQMERFIAVMEDQHSQRKSIHKQEREAAKEKYRLLNAHRGACCHH